LNNNLLSALGHQLRGLFFHRAARHEGEQPFVSNNYSHTRHNKLDFGLLLV